MARSVNDVYDQIFYANSRLISVVRNPDPDRELLEQFLDGEPTVETVTKLVNFVRKYMERPERSDLIRSKILAPCIAYLEANGAPIPPEPYPLPGEPGFHSVLEEFGE